MCDFIYMYDFFTRMLYDGDGRKKKWNVQNETKEKFPVWFPSYPPVNKMEGDCFLVSENKPDQP